MQKIVTHAKFYANFKRKQFVVKEYGGSPSKDGIQDLNHFFYFV